MSYYRVCIIEIERNKVINSLKFDNKEDAEHYAKNTSVGDHKHHYQVQKNNHGEFETIKSYVDGQEN